MKIVLKVCKYSQNIRASVYRYIRMQCSLFHTCSRLASWLVKESKVCTGFPLILKEESSIL
jgi:hypothetical protein